MNPERLTVRIPDGWKRQLTEIAKVDDRDISSLTRRALVKAHPELKQLKNSTQ